MVNQRRGGQQAIYRWQLLSALFSGTCYTSPCAGDMLVNRKNTSDETSSQINVYPNPAVLLAYRRQQAWQRLFGALPV